MIKHKIYEDLIEKKTKLAVVGLGYVGLPIAHAFTQKVDVIGFDINEEKIDIYKMGIDPTNEIGDEAISHSTIEFTSNSEKLGESSFLIVAVPTPVNRDHTPNLNPLKSVSKLLGKSISKNSIIVFESTVYPGVTEEICVPIIEEYSGMKCGIDFKIGYSPERINPGGKTHRLENIVKIVSGMDEETLDIVSKVYEMVIDAGVFRAESIMVAEAAKVIENSQRDINIAFMNELSIIFNMMDIDTNSVLAAANTKWNFLNFKPGLVGGHCIGVDPYYLTYKAESLGYHSQVILSGRRINDNVGKYVVENTIKKLIKADIAIKNAKVAILGFTFKENCPDTRNTRVIDIVDELKHYEIYPMIVDPVGNREDTLNEYNIELTKYSDLKDLDAIILAVSHDEFKAFQIDDFNKMYNQSTNCSKVMIDVKGILNKKEYEDSNYQYWSL